MVLPSFPRAVRFWIAGPEEAKNLAGKSPPPDSDPFSDAEFGKNLAGLSSKLAATSNRRFEFEKGSQLFIRMHNETLSVASMRVSNPDCSRLRIKGCDAAPTPTGFALGIVDQVQRRFSCFKLCAHLLDLRCLLFHRCDESFDFLLLLCASLLLLCHGSVEPRDRRF